MDYVVFQGKGSWFQHLFMLDDISDPARWHVTIHFTPESLETFRGLKLRTHLKKDDEGYYSKLSCPCRKIIMRGAKEIVFKQPTVFDKDGLPWVQDNRIGNGSDISAKCELYQFSPPGAKNKENAIRLSSVRIDNYVPYDTNRDYTPELAKAAEGLTSIPAPVWG